MKCMDCRVGIYQNILITRLSFFEIPFIVVLMVNRSFEVHKLIYFRNAKMFPKIMTRRKADRHTLYILPIYLTCFLE